MGEREGVYGGERGVCKRERGGVWGREGGM